MSAKLYVGNLSYSCDDQSLQEAFSSFGEVVSARVITDKMSGRSKGFGFVEMGSAEAASKAIEAMNGREFMGRNLSVSEARPQEDRPRRSFSDRPRRSGSFGGRSRY